MPTNKNCSTCHGLVHDSKSPLEFERENHIYMTERTGAIVSDQLLSKSYLLAKSQKNL